MTSPGEQDGFRKLPSFDEWRTQHGSVPPVIREDIEPATVVESREDDVQHAETTKAPEPEPPHVTTAQAPAPVTAPEPDPAEALSEILTRRKAVAAEERARAEELSRRAHAQAAEELAQARFAALAEAEREALAEAEVQAGAQAQAAAAQALAEAQAAAEAHSKAEIHVADETHHRAEEQRVAAERRSRKKSPQETTAIIRWMQRVGRGVPRGVPRRFLISLGAAIGTVTLLLIVVISMGTLTFIKPTVGSNTSLGPAASVLVVAIPRTDVTLGDAIIGEFATTPQGEKTIVLGIIRGMNNETYAVSDGTSSWQIPRNRILGKVLLPSVVP